MPAYDAPMTEPGFERVAGQAPPLFLCDHASSALPPAYGGLGLSQSLFETHIAYDIGAASVTRTLAAGFGSPALLGAWSRLLIDLNRGEGDPTLVMQLSDGSIIPGNRHLDAGERLRRIDRFHAPYHQAVGIEIERLTASSGKPPPLISIHSFTPVWKGKPRPWDVGILWDRDRRLAAPLMARLGQAGFAVGDNEPYSGALEGDTLNRHGTSRFIPHVLIEIRQDLIASDGLARAFATRLKPILKAALADMDAAD